jgi:5-hydroxyisourate hydrolase
MTSAESSPRLTTHVLDLASGRPAEGLGFSLSRLDGPAAEVILRSRTNGDGRTDGPLLAGSEFGAGHYELAFEVADYFAAQAERLGSHFGVEPPSLPFLDIVPIRFGVAAGTSHLHVALLVTPWSYSTYRGS